MFRDLPKNTFFSKIFKFTGRFIDFPSAIAGGVMMGVIVFFINFRFGTWPAMTAAIKQTAYTFFFGGIIISLLYRMVQYMPGKISGIILPVIITSVLTITLVFFVHSLKGTPLPVQSTIPTVVLAPPGFFFLALRRRKRSR